MGGVWCKADRRPTTSYSSKESFTATISRWTDQMRQIYKKPKNHHRPPRPPEKPLRMNERLTISHPQLVEEQSSDGWRTATLLVPQTTPVPPPRKKRRSGLLNSARAARSMDDLNNSWVDLSTSTFSLPEIAPSELVLSVRSASSTLIVTPILESRDEPKSDLSVRNQEQSNMLDDANERKNSFEDDANERSNVGEELFKNHIINQEETQKINNSEDEFDDEDFSDEIHPVEKEIYSSRTILHSNLGYIDKLSAISEVSIESGFDDRLDVGKFSDRSESVNSCESIAKDSGLCTSDDIQATRQWSGSNSDVHVRKAISKKEWLENILKDEEDARVINKDTNIWDIGRETIARGQPISTGSEHLHLMNLGMDTSVAGRTNNTPSQSPSLGQLRANSEYTSTPYVHERESIFLTNTRTNIIYKSLSSDCVTDQYLGEYPTTNKTELPQPITGEDTAQNNVVSTIILPSDLSNETHGLSPNNSNNKINCKNSDTTPNIVISKNTCNELSCFGINRINKGEKFVTIIEDVTNDITPTKETILIKNKQIQDENAQHFSPKQSDLFLGVDKTGANGSASSSRRSSLTDSLHEFELSIYDMLKESHQESSDEEESIKTIKADTRG